MKKKAGLLNTKNGMRNRIKHIISGLMCMALLVVCAVPVNAGQYMDDFGMETFGACGHAKFFYTKPVQRYTMTNSLTHRKYDYQERYCKDCGALLNTYTYDRGEENHSLSYQDLGHKDMTHNYRINCNNCGFNTTTSVPCSNNGSSYNTPW